MINRKLKATLSLVLALIVMCSACVVPVFALDDVGGGGVGGEIAIQTNAYNMACDKLKSLGCDTDNVNYIFCTGTQWNEKRYFLWVLNTDSLDLENFVSKSFDARFYCQVNYNMNTGKMYIERSGINASYSNMSFYNATGNTGGQFHVVHTNIDISNNGTSLNYPGSQPYIASITYDDDSKNFLFDFEPRKSDEVYNVNIAVSNQSEWDYPNSDGWYYLPMDTSGDFTKENPLHGSIPLNVMRDGIMRYNSNKDIENTGKLYFFLIAAKGKGDEALYKDRFCAASYEYSLVDTVDSHKKEPFSEKKDYEEFPSLSDYIDTDFPDIRDYVNFDMFHDLDGIADFVKAVVEFLWNAFTGFFRWLWAALKFVFFNFLGIFEWLGKCLWTIVKNIGIALYNLVVDLKKLVTYLFVPNSKDLNVAIESKFPAYAKLRKAFQQGKQSSSNSVTFTLFGKDFDFNMNSAPNELKSALFNASTIAMYAICIYATIKALFRCFGIQLHESSESEGE